jgi:MFS family permease
MVEKEKKATEGSKAIAYDVQEEQRESKYGKGYKWVVLSNTTLGALMAAIDSSIVLISLPAIFAGLGVNPLIPSNIGLLIWMLLGYMIVTSVLLVTIGRLSDMYGRVKLYNIGFMIFAISSVLIYVSSYLILGTAGAISIIVLRLFQALGGSFLFANFSALITDAFPRDQRGMALGISGVAFSGGSIIGLIIGGVLAAIDWHLIFLISVPVGVIGAIWSYVALHEIATIKKGRKLDIPGNVTFAVSLTVLLVSLTYALFPYGTHKTGWTNPFVLAGIAAGIILFILFIIIETRTEDPMFNLGLLKIRNYAAGLGSGTLASIARGGLQFMLIIWLQGIWLPQHGVTFTKTPLIAALYMLPLTIGFLVTGPISGKLSDKYGARILSTLGMSMDVVSFLILSTFPGNFTVLPFVIVTLMLGIGQGLFISPNITSIMNSVPPEQRGSASGMRSTLQNLSQMLSIIIFFSLLIFGLGKSLSTSIYTGLVSQGVSQANATVLSNVPPTSAIFAAFLGYNPLKTIIPAQILSNLTATQQSVITGTSFFPGLISVPFMSSLQIVLYVAAAMSLIAAIISSMRSKGVVYDSEKTVVVSE